MFAPFFLLPAPALPLKCEGSDRVLFSSFFASAIATSCSSRAVYSARTWEASLRTPSPVVDNAITHKLRSPVDANCSEPFDVELTRWRAKGRMYVGSYLKESN